MQSLSLKDKAIAFLARREHSREELAQKLARYSAQSTREEIESVLNELVQSNLLSDTRFVERYLASKTARFGRHRLIQALRAKGITNALIETGMAEYAASGHDELTQELTRAQSIWHKKFGVLPVERLEYARQARFLQGRGFGTDIIRRVLQENNNESA